MNVLILLDRNDVGKHFQKYLRDREHIAEWCSTAVDSITRIKQGLADFDVIFLHKDLGEPTHEIHFNSSLAARLIHEEAPHVRLGIVSGEYPDGEKHVKELRADFYCSYLNLMDFGIRQIEKGIVSPDDRNKRGFEIETPRFSFGIERY